MTGILRHACNMYIYVTIIFVRQMLAFLARIPKSKPLPHTYRGTCAHTIVCWQLFLHLRHTRAVLRNCTYDYSIDSRGEGDDSRGDNVHERAWGSAQTVYSDESWIEA